ncbi:MAG: hypothetical protein KDD33_01925 [Bdellovibrionales bacterium]|nr:hypothetical protein [Bdellovibrionales bacterium]
MTRFCLSLPALFLMLFLPTRAVAQGQHFDRILIIVFENTDYDQALKQPFFKKMADEGVLFTNFDGLTHPSQGNYIAMTSGSTHGIHHDKTVTLNVNHIGDLLEEKGLSWKLYAEDYPGHCYKKNYKNYVRRHNPFMSYANVQNDPLRCQNIVNASEFDLDVKNKSLPHYAIYVPTLNNDGHDKGVKFADRWYKKTFEPYLKDPNFTKGLLLVSTFDESKTRYHNHIYTSLWGEALVSGTRLTEAHNHYSIMKLIEENFGLDNLGLNDSTAPSIEDIWVDEL